MRSGLVTVLFRFYLYRLEKTGSLAELQSVADPRQRFAAAARPARRMPAACPPHACRMLAAAAAALAPLPRLRCPPVASAPPACRLRCPRLSPLRHNPSITRAHAGCRVQGSGWRPARARQSEAGWTTFKAYGTSKLAGTALTYELARRLAASGVSSMVCTPGMVNTELSRFAPLLLRALSWPLRFGLLRTPAQGADTPIWRGHANLLETE